VPDGRVDYDEHAASYPLRRRADPLIASYIAAALSDARTVLNVGAGAGSYEPDDRYVLAVEPSAGMRSQRPADRAPAIAASAEDLPLDEDAFEASMALATVHHWQDLEAGLRELRRVTSGPVVVLTFDPDALGDYWLLRDYLSGTPAGEREWMPSVAALGAILGGVVKVQAIPILAGCCDGFLEAYYNNPEAFLQAEVRAAQSLWPSLPAGAQQRALYALQADLHSGRWDERNGQLRSAPAYEGSLRLITSLPD
jgi:SAM-dependent methyltransferase